MALATPRFIPRPARPAPLNWIGDPLFRANKVGITPTQGRAGLAFNRALYAPDSPLLHSVVTPPPAPVYPTVPQGPTAPVRAGSFVSRYGTVSVRNETNPADGIANPNLVTEGPDESGLYPPADGTTGPTGEGGPASPALTPAPAVDNPNIGGPIDYGTAAINPGAPDMSSSNASSGEQNPLTNPPKPLTRSSSSADQTQRFYDRKFGRMSSDPAERMQARRIVGHAAVVDGSTNLRGSSDPNGPPPVTFNNDVPGHSDWRPY